MVYRNIGIFIGFMLICSSIGIILASVTLKFLSVDPNWLSPIYWLAGLLFIGIAGIIFAILSTLEKDE